MSASTLVRALLLLQAVALQAGGDTARAIMLLQRTLRLAEPEGYVRVFVDEGALMAALLLTAHTRGVAPAYVPRLLAAFPSIGERPPADPVLADTKHVPHSVLSTQHSALTERELEVLRLLAAGYANQAIAGELVVAVGTVKRHINSIFGKLGVQSRLEAARRARELDLV